jgi:hypothetical protein
MKFAGPTKPHRKSGMWGTRGFVEGIEFDVQSCEGIALKAFEGLRPSFSAQVSGFPARGATNTRVCGFH